MKPILSDQVALRHHGTLNFPVDATVSLYSKKIVITDKSSGEVLYDIALTEINKLRKGFGSTFFIKTNEYDLALEFNSVQAITLLNPFFLGIFGPLIRSFRNKSKPKMWVNTINQCRNKA